MVAIYLVYASKNATRVFIVTADNLAVYMNHCISGFLTKLGLTESIIVSDVTEFQTFLHDTADKGG